MFWSGKLLSLSRPSMRRGVSDPFNGPNGSKPNSLTRQRIRQRPPVPDFSSPDGADAAPSSGPLFSSSLKASNVHDLMASPSTPATMRATRFPRMRTASCSDSEGEEDRNRGECQGLRGGRRQIHLRASP